MILKKDLFRSGHDQCDSTLIPKSQSCDCTYTSNTLSTKLSKLYVNEEYIIFRKPIKSFVWIWNKGILQLTCIHPIAYQNVNKFSKWYVYIRSHIKKSKLYSYLYIWYYFYQIIKVVIDCGCLNVQIFTLTDILMNENSLGNSIFIQH